jgi:two-component system nitrogen regulation response regulator GlnG
MSVPSSSFTILLLTNDTAVQALVRQVFKDASVTIVRDVSTFLKELPRHRFDAAVM